MRSAFGLQRLLGAMLLIVGAVRSQGANIPTAVTLGVPSATGPFLLGQRITLSAIVLPEAVTGKVVLFDGTSILGAVTLAKGRAVFATGLLPAGKQELKAMYTGDTRFAPSSSKVVSLTIDSLAADGFDAPVEYGDRINSTSIAIGDFNGDGRADLAVTPDGNPQGGTVNVFLGNGDGTFQPAVHYVAGVEPGSVAIGDFNGDGKTDLAVTDFNFAVRSIEGTVSILLGNGDGTFQQASNFFEGWAPNYVGIADFNGDGLADLVVTNLYGDDISLQLGNGDGTFHQAAKLILGLGLQAATIGDFNADGRADVAVVSEGTLCILLGNGDGTFQTPVYYRAGKAPTFVTAGDFNGDGILDLAVSEQVSGSVEIFLGNGDGTFADRIAYPAGSEPESLAIGDFNGDGKSDLAVADYDGGFSVLYGNGNGTFKAGVHYDVGIPSVFLAVGEFNGDSRSDLVVGDIRGAAMSVLLGVCTKSCVEPGTQGP